MRFNYAKRRTATSVPRWRRDVVRNHATSLSLTQRGATRGREAQKRILTRNRVVEGRCKREKPKLNAGLPTRHYSTQQSSCVFQTVMGLRRPATEYCTVTVSYRDLIGGWVSDVSNRSALYVQSILSTHRPQNSQSSVLINFIAYFIQLNNDLIITKPLLRAQGER